VWAFVGVGEAGEVGGGVERVLFGVGWLFHRR
jgi:hypothetical protein